MALLIRPGEAWQEPEHIQSRQPDGTLQDIEAVRAKIGEEYIDVWPEYEQAVHYAMLYYYGDECADLTGGWSSIKQGYNSSLSFHGDANMTKNSDHIRSYMHLDKNYYSWSKLLVYTSKKIKLDGYVGAAIKATINADCPAEQNSVSSIENITEFYQQETAFRIIGLPTKNSSAIQSNGIYKAEKGMSGANYIGLENCARGTEEGYGGEINLYALWLYQSDDWQEWLSKADLSVASLAAVMADSAALTTLLSSYAATQYMLLQCTGDVMASAIQSSAFLAALAASPYKDKVYANPHWAKFLKMT